MWGQNGFQISIFSLKQHSTLCECGVYSRLGCDLQSPIHRLRNVCFHETVGLLTLQKVSWPQNWAQCTTAIYRCSCVPIQLCRSLYWMHFILYILMTFPSSSGHKNTLICLCISGSIAVGAAPESFVFPAVNLAALILTARTVLWQTSAETRHRSCLLMGDTAGQRQQEADRGVSTCSPPCPTESFLFFLTEISLWGGFLSSTTELLKGTGSFRSCYYGTERTRDSTAVSLKTFLSLLPSNQWMFSYGFNLGCPVVCEAQ